MPSTLHPGVYIQEVPSGARPIEGVPTSIAAFVGWTARRPVDPEDPVDTGEQPTLIFGWDDYVDRFGGIQDVVPGTPSNGSRRGDDYMGYSVRAFFQNGGKQAYIVGLKREGAKQATQSQEGLTFTACDEGFNGNAIVVQVTPDDPVTPVSYTVTVYRRLTLPTNGIAFDPSNAEELETFRSVRLTTTSDNPDEDHDFIKTRINTVSRWVTVDTGTNPVQNGNDGTELDSDSYQSAFDNLEKIRDVSVLCLPGQQFDRPKLSSSAAIIDAAIAHAEEMGDRMVIVDPPKETKLVDASSVHGLDLPSRTYAVLYYPWVNVANPHYQAETSVDRNETVWVPPSGFAAGMWSRIDARRGVWKAPAGVETSLLGVAGLRDDVGDAEQDYLNPLGVNVVRVLPSYGPVIWGARTLATKSKPEWRYVPVRRTAIFIERSIYDSIQWAVFEPNDHRLWSSLRANIASFMNGLFRAGAFQGEKTSDAYFVRCGFDDTMTQADIDRGQVIVIVGFAPVKPAEFVIVRIQQQVGQ